MVHLVLAHVHSVYLVAFFHYMHLFSMEQYYKDAAGILTKLQDIFTVTKKCLVISHKLM